MTLHICKMRARPSAAARGASNGRDRVGTFATAVPSTVAARTVCTRDVCRPIVFRRRRPVARRRRRRRLVVVGRRRRGLLRR